MSQRQSGFERQAGDQYMTPEWVTETLLHVMPPKLPAWEPACGTGSIAKVLRAAGVSVIATDINDEFCQHGQPLDFLKIPPPSFALREPLLIVTNPPYGRRGLLAEAFVRHAIHNIARYTRGEVAMLLPVDWDAAKTRRDLFEDFPYHITKITLTKRIRWTNLLQSASGPSQNHARFVWSCDRTGRDMRWLGENAK